MVKWHTQAGNIATNVKFEVDFTLLGLSAMNILTCQWHTNESAKGRYDRILGRYLWTELWLNLNSLIVSLKQIMEILNGLQHPWLIWVCMNLKLTTGKITPVKSRDWTLDLIYSQLPCKFGSYLTINFFVKQTKMGKSRLCVCGAKNRRV